MKSRTFFALILLHLICQSVMGTEQDFYKYWDKQPQSVRIRVEEALMSADDAWVPRFADSLAHSFSNSNDLQYQFFAEKILYTRAFYINDSVGFFKHVPNAKRLALECKSETEYYKVCTDEIYFTLLAGHHLEAHTLATVMLEKAKDENSDDGVYYANMAFAALNMDCHNWKQSIESYKRALNMIKKNKKDDPVLYNHVYTLLAQTYVKAEMWIDALNTAMTAWSYEGENSAPIVIMATCNYELGRLDDCRSNIDTFRHTSFGDHNNDLVNGYMIDILDCVLHKKWDVADELCDKLEESQRNDWRLRIYTAQGRWHDAYDIMKRMWVYGDSIHGTILLDEMAKVNTQLEHLHKDHEKHRQIFRQRIIMTVLGMGIILLVVVVVMQLRAKRAMEAKNQALARDIDELSKYKAEEDEEDQTEEVSKVIHPEITMFISRMVQKGLFINPDFEKNTLLLEMHLPRSKFNKHFREHTGMSFTQYLLNVRLDYSLGLLRDHPELTVEAVAVKSGIPNRFTYLRNFQNAYGLTPREYRKGLTGDSLEEDNPK